MQSPGQQKMVREDFYEATLKRTRINMRNFYVNSVKDRRTISMHFNGFGSFRYGSNFQVFVWYMHVGTSLEPHLDARQCFTDEGLREALRRGSEAYVAAEVLLKGPEQRLPSGMTFLDKGGHKRQDVRTRWWDPYATTFRQAAIGVEDIRGELPDAELPIDFRYLESTPVLFGHYWMPGEPTIEFPNVGCLDFSVAMKGCLTAYRWSGESELSSEHLIYVPANDPGDDT